MDDCDRHPSMLSLSSSLESGEYPVVNIRGHTPLGLGRGFVTMIRVGLELEG